MQPQILNLLARGLSQAEVARATGASEGYISQLVNDPDFKLKLNEARALRVNVASDLDDHYDKIETVVVNRLTEVTAKAAHLMQPDQLIKIAKFANEAKRRSTVDLTRDSKNSDRPLVVINLPNANIPGLQVVKSSNNEVLEIGGQALLPMDSKTLLNRNAANQQITLESI